MAQQVIDTETGQVFAYTDDDQPWYEDVSDFLGNPGGTIVEGIGGFFADDDTGQAAADVGGGMFAGGAGGGGGQPSAGGLPPLPGMSGGGSLVPGGGGQVPAPSNGAPTGIESVPSQVARWALQVFSQNPQWLKAIARRLGIMKGSPAHDNMAATPGCVSKLAEMLPKSKREAVEQYMCGFADAMGSADEDTFLALVIANSGADASVCKCD